MYVAFRECKARRNACCDKDTWCCNNILEVKESFMEENKERKIVVTPSSDGITVKLIYELQEEIGKQTT